MDGSTVIGKTQKDEKSRVKNPRGHKIDAESKNKMVWDSNKKNSSHTANYQIVFCGFVSCSALE